MKRPQSEDPWDPSLHVRWFGARVLGAPSLQGVWCPFGGAAYGSLSAPFSCTRGYLVPSPRLRCIAGSMPLVAFLHPSSMRRATWYPSSMSEVYLWPGSLCDLLVPSPMVTQSTLLDHITMTSRSRLTSLSYFTN